MSNEDPSCSVKIFKREWKNLIGQRLGHVTFQPEVWGMGGPEVDTMRNRKYSFNQTPKYWKNNNTIFENENHLFIYNILNF